MIFEEPDVRPYKVAFTIPSARPIPDLWRCLSEWIRRHYLIAVWRDKLEQEFVDVITASTAKVIILSGEYPGYAKATNALVAHVLHHYPEVDFCVGGGDDVFPSEIHPEFISEGLKLRFGGTFGCAQPTGDRWADGSIDKIAGSPWMGREWARRAHQGQGPFCPEFFHMFSDEALTYAAEREGVYQRLPDVVQRHQHFCRDGENVNWGAAVPPHLTFANSDKHWAESRATFERFKREYETKWRPLPEVLNG